MTTSARLAVVFGCCCLASLFGSLSVAFDGKPTSEKWSTEELQVLAGRIASDEKQLTPEERKEILQYALSPQSTPEYSASLFVVHFVSAGRIDTAGPEVAPFADKLEAGLRSVTDINIWKSYAMTLAFAFEDRERGDALEEKWFKLIETESADRQVAFFEALGVPKWISPEKRLNRLAAAYNSEKISQEAREKIVEVVYAGVCRSQLKVSEACLFYRDLTSSKWSSPALTFQMFDRISDIAVLAERFDELNSRLQE